MNSFSIFSETREWLKKNKIEALAFESTTSTNDLAKLEIFKGQQKVYIADEQTKGRGRGSNTWLNSTPGSALMASWAFLLSESPQNITGPIFGLAVYRALASSFTGAALSIKAPNDIYLKSKKILGILIETVKQGDKCGLVVGIGLNVFSNPEEIENSECLSRTVAVTKENWAQFLRDLDQNLSVAARASTHSHLTDQDREDLRAALNRFEGLPSPFISVSPFGDLSTESAVISWRQL